MGSECSAGLWWNCSPDVDLGAIGVPSALYMVHTRKKRMLVVASRLFHCLQALVSGVSFLIFSFCRELCLSSSDLDLDTIFDSGEAWEYGSVVSAHAYQLLSLSITVFLD